MGGSLQHAHVGGDAKLKAEYLQNKAEFSCNSLCGMISALSLPANCKL